MFDLEKKFLIRSSGHILGPFSKQEVIDLTKRGKISAFDEVAEPFTIWWYLQDHQDFKGIVRSLDSQTRLANFLTQISSKIFTVSKTEEMSDQTITDTKTQEQTKTAESFSGSDGNLKISQLGSHEKQAAHEVQFEVVDQLKRASLSQARYTSQKDSEEIIRKRIGAIIRISWQLIVALALFIGAYILYKEVIAPARQEKAVSEKFQANGLKFYKVGKYQKALPYFEEAYSKGVLKTPEKILLASLFIKADKIQRVFSIVNELSGSQPKSGNWFLLNGLLSFFQEDFSKADQYFKSALKSEAKNLALLNLSLLKRQTGEYDKSSSYLNQLIESAYERDIVFYVEALNLLSQGKMGELASHISQELLNQESSLVEYRQELFLLLAYSYMKEQKPEELEKTVQTLLNEDPFLEREYHYSSFIATQSLKWSALYPYCRGIFESDSKNSLFNALYGFCYLKTGNLKQGSKYVEQDKNREPDNPLFLSLYAYSLMLQDKDLLQLEQVFVLMDYDKLNHTLPLVLRARFLEEKQDWVRALKVWKKLLSLEANNLSGIAGVAYASYKLRDASTADVYREKGLNQYPYHVRLLSYGN